MARGMAGGGEAATRPISGGEIENRHTAVAAEEISAFEILVVSRLVVGEGNEL